MTSRNKTCMLCSKEGHSLINCPYKCDFCGDLQSSCDCNNSSLVEKVTESEKGDMDVKERQGTRCSKQRGRKRSNRQVEDSEPTTSKPKEDWKLKYLEASGNLNVLQQQHDELRETSRNKEDDLRIENEHLEGEVKRLQEALRRAKDRRQDEYRRQEETKTSEDESTEEESEEGEKEERKECPVVKPTEGKEWGSINATNLAGVHARYMHVLTIYGKSDKPLAEALRAAKVARNTLRDYLGMAELKIVDERKYDDTITRVRRQKEKPSVKDFEKACRNELVNYYQELNEKKGTKLLLPLMTQKSFYEM